MNSGPNFESMMLGGPGSFILLAFFGLLLLGGLALFIYSIVAKKYWLTMLMVLLPAGLILMLFAALVGFQTETRHAEAVAEANDVLTKAPYETSVEPLLPDEPWSKTLPPTADIYPSIALCGRPLAYQIAGKIRQTITPRHSMFSVTFSKEQRPGDHTQWKPPEEFVASFRKEFLKQFPRSKVRKTVDMAEAESVSTALKPLEVKLSFKPPENKNTNPQTAAGSISARWTTFSDTRAVASIKFVNKPWVIDPEKYLADNNLQQLAVGFSQRLARSPAEATNMALDNAGRQGRNISSRFSTNQIVDRFVQKLSLPYGELWQESVLVDPSITPASAFASSSTAKPAFRSPGSAGRTKGTARPPAGFTKLNGLILITFGLIAIGIISNLLTQGYYRQNIKHVVGTGVVALFGLLILLLLLVDH